MNQIPGLSRHFHSNTVWLWVYDMQVTSEVAVDLQCQAGYSQEGYGFFNCKPMGNKTTWMSYMSSD